MNSLKRIIKDGGCAAFDCPACALYHQGSGCELLVAENHKVYDKFTHAELDFVKKKLEEKSNDKIGTNKTNS